jgi:hemoglobin
MSDQPGVTLYEYVGGTPFFERLVDAFYDGVASDPVLRPMYPDELDESKAHLVGFLVQYWGGPTDYSDARGHPRLRMRHAPFVIDDRARDAWLAHMTAAVASSGADDVASRALLSYFASAADAMINAR